MTIAGGMKTEHGSYIAFVMMTLNTAEVGFVSAILFADLDLLVHHLD
jgi:hypothetical protein